MNEIYLKTARLLIQVAPVVFADQAFALTGGTAINLFVREVSDAIAPVSAPNAAGRWVEQRINAGDARVWGIELDAKTGLVWAGLGRDWTLSANASLLQSRMTSGVNAGNRIPGQARYTANVTVAKPIRRTGGLFGGGTLTLTGPADLDSSPGIRIYRSIRSARAARFPDGNVSPVTPGITRSGAHPTLSETIAGRPEAIASFTTRPHVS